ncbi:hypothetical protein ACIBJF_23040, partial [Streptomyces sp. NPDC050743]|uniref:hypothetical protein n=1 Tax=Streptomyces sp. NPDC050743 TaxID=3365634 RepID=UPI003792E7B8
IMAPTSCFTGQVHRLPDAPEAYGAMITRAKAAPPQSRYADLSTVVRRRDHGRSGIEVPRKRHRGTMPTHILTGGGANMTEEEALRQLRRVAQERALGRHVGSDRLIQAGLDALLAGVDTPSIALLAGLGRREEPEAPDLFDQVLEELSLHFETPADPTAASWALIYWLAEQIVDGSLDPATGADQIWLEMLTELDLRWPYPEELHPIALCASDLEDWNESWDISLDDLKAKAFQAAQHLLRARPPEESERRSE